MNRLMTIKGALAFAIGIFAFNFVLVLTGVYDAWPNTDIPMHMLGGLAMGFLAWGVSIHFIRKIRYENHKPVTRYLMSLLYILGFVALIGVAWEMYEYVADVIMQTYFTDMNDQLAGTRQNGVEDMLGDFVMDFIGGFVAWWLGKDT